MRGQPRLSLCIQAPHSNLSVTSHHITPSPGRDSPALPRQGSSRFLKASQEGGREGAGRRWRRYKGPRRGLRVHLAHHECPLPPYPSSPCLVGSTPAARGDGGRLSSVDTGSALVTILSRVHAEPLPRPAASGGHHPQPPGAR